MSKLEELLQGVNVEWKILSEISNIGTGNSNRQDEDEKGIYPFYVRSKKILKSNTYQFDEISIIIPGEGGIGDIFHYVEGKYALHQRAYRINIISNYIITKYVYYIMLNSFKHYISGKSIGTTATSIRKPMLEKFKIPIPCPDNPKKSLEIQQEIVRVLDELTSLTNQLTTELETERQNRKKQFEYFREQLFTFEEGKAEWKSLKDVAEYSKKRINFTYLNESNYVGVDNLLQNRGGKINSKHIPTEGNSTAFLTNNILIGNIRPYLKKIWLADCDGGSNGDVLVINIIDKIIHHKYLYHILSNDEFFKYNMQHAKGAKMPRGNKQKIMEYIFPIPSLAEQERIVKLLDQFDATHTAIEEEITKEIKLRTQQYEYYREKLLTFPEN
ncbi:MAG: restriction endonuclease subunit S [Weeksellaceae bacterium]|nr:restriction endonuclease subunit S [Weeksellaceae bacterium]